MTPSHALTPPTAPDGMEMLRLRRSAPVLLALALAAVLSLIGLRMGDLAAPHADVTQLPTAFGNWVMTGSEKTNPDPIKGLALDDHTAQALALDSYTQRTYLDRATGRQITLLLEYRRLGRGAFNHRPEACYPAADYALTGRAETPILYGGQAAQAVTCVADYRGHLGSDHQVLLYWFATGRRVEGNFFKQQVEMAFGRLQPDKNGWAFVRLVCECPPSQNAAALAAEKDFVQQASPAMIQAISTPTGT